VGRKGEGGRAFCPFDLLLMVISFALETAVIVVDGGGSSLWLCGGRKLMKWCDFSVFSHFDFCFSLKDPTLGLFWLFNLL